MSATEHTVPLVAGTAAAPAASRRRRRLPLSVWLAGGLVLALVLVALLAPLLAPHPPNDGSLSERLLDPGTGGHLLGTDSQGRDILSRLIWGTRPSLIAGVVPVIIAGTIGTALGMLARLGSRRVEDVVMRSLDVLFAFPAVLLALAIAAAVGAGLMSLIVALTVALIPSIGRVVQTEVARIRAADFMDAARTSGAGGLAIALRQVLPIVLPSTLVYCTALVGISIVYAAGLSFLGLGVSPPSAEWGSMLNELRQNIYTSPTLALIPAGVIFVASAAFGILGDGLLEIFDVRAETRA